MKYKAPRGTADILPGEVEKWQFLESKMRDVCRAFNYREVRTPMFEHIELFQRGVGETTDIVEKEMYAFQDRGGREIALRPEMTAAAVRAFVEHKFDKQPQPTKWYYIGPMFRYERPQAGRERQFTQFGVELFGTHDPAADAEVISLALETARAVGLTQLKTEINSIGCSACRPLYREKLIAYFTPHRDQLCKDCQSRLERNPLRILDCKRESCQAVAKDAPSILDVLCDNCDPHFQAVRQLLEATGIDYVVNDRLVRGLDYYTQTAFEIKSDTLGAQSTIFAGGRYNDLVREIGGADLPGIGFASGIERILLALEKEGVQLPVDDGIDCFIVALGEQAKVKASGLVHSLRRAGCSADRDYMDRKVKGQMKAADRLKARFAVVIGDDELARSAVQVKDLSSGEQEEVDMNDLVDYIRSRIRQEGV